MNHKNRKYSKIFAVSLVCFGNYGYLCHINMKPEMDTGKDLNRRLPQIIEIPHEQVVMAFVATCVEAVARTQGKTYREVYDRMNRLGLIDNYIYPCYNTLHTESRENIVEDLLTCMNNWEAKGL